PPNGDGTAEQVPEPRPRQDFVRVGHAEPISYDADDRAPAPAVCAPSFVLPEPGAPGAVRADRETPERQAGEGARWSGKAAFSDYVIPAHALPTGIWVA